MARGAILWANDGDGAVLSASAAYSTLPVTFLQTPQLDQRWRTNDGLASAWVTADLLTATAVDFVALMATNLTATATMRTRVSTSSPTGGDLHDSGTISANIDIAYPHLVYVLPAPVSGRYVRVDLADAALLQFESGRLVLGRLFRPAQNFTRGYLNTAKDSSRVDESIGGQEWVERRAARRGISLRFPALTAAERRTYAIPMQIQRGISQDIGVLTNLATVDPGEDFVWGLPQRLATVRNVFLDRTELELEVSERAWR